MNGGMGVERNVWGMEVVDMREEIEKEVGRRKK